MALPGCFYTHKKTGNRYKVLRILPIRTGEEWVSGYLYENERGEQFARSQVQFHQGFEHADDCEEKWNGHSVQEAPASGLPKRVTDAVAALATHYDELPHASQRDAVKRLFQMVREVLDNVRDNINPERGYADELEADVAKAIAAIDMIGPGVEVPRG